MTAPGRLRRPWTRRLRASRAELAALGVEHPLLAQLLLHRGFADPEAAKLHLDPPRPSVPGIDDLAGLCAAIARVERALDAGESIVVYGDYDVDGLSGASVLHRTLMACGGRVRVFIPHRDRDGYGLNAESLQALAAEGVGLVLTVDCGVTASSEIAAANASGLDVVVTDHHQLSGEIPAAVAVVNPHRPDCPYPFKQLAGAGVALKVAQTLASRRLDPAAYAALEPTLLGLAALGTVSDVMPLTGENRAIVRHGLRALNTRPPVGLAALFRRAGLARPWIEADDISFKIAPRLNAAGRIGEASTTLWLLSTADPIEAEELADQLEAMNAERREIAAAALEDAREQVATLRAPLPAGVVVRSSFPSGVLGLVAVKLCEELGRPVAVVEEAEGLCRASVRAPKGHDAVAAVTAGASLLARYGGHQGAAGFSIDTINVDAFAELFAEAVAAQPLAPSDDELTADAWLQPTTINAGLLDQLARLGPFGHGYPEPLFETRSLEVRGTSVVGEKHLRLQLSQEGRLLRAIAFNAADEPPRVGEHVDILYRVKTNVWQGERRPDIQLEAWRPAMP